MRPTIWLPSVLLATACSSGLTPDELRDGIPAHGVEVVATATRIASGDNVTIRITNVGSQAAFLSRCGNQPLVLGRQFVGSEWTGGVQNILCLVPSTPGPIRLGPMESITVLRVFDAAGRYRFVVPVSSMEDQSDANQAVSNAFDVT